MRALWRTIWHYPLTLDKCICSDPASLLQICTLGTSALLLQEILARMYIAALFTEDPKCKPPKCPFRITCKNIVLFTYKWNPTKHWKLMNSNFTRVYLQNITWNEKKSKEYIQFDFIYTKLKIDKTKHHCSETQICSETIIINIKFGIFLNSGGRACRKVMCLGRHTQILTKFYF